MYHSKLRGFVSEVEVAEHSMYESQSEEVRGGKV